VSFILWMCGLLKPQVFEEKQTIFMENDKIDGIFFLIKGLAAFVLPRYKNVPYINITVGNHFGVIDIVGSLETLSIPL
jgi:hypothetical protein